MHHSISTKVTSIIAATTLAMSMAPTMAFAAFDDAGNAGVTDVDPTTVTINGLKTGDTVTAYRVADVHIDADNSLHWDMAADLPQAYDTIAELEAIQPQGGDGYNFTSVSTAAQTAAGAIAVSRAVTNPADGATVTSTATSTNTGVSATLSLDSGYWLVRVSNASGNNDTVYQNMLVNLTPAVDGLNYKSAADTNITAKKESVSLDKKSHEADAAKFNVTEVKSFKVGDKVPFQIVTAVPSYPADATNAVFTITDDPDEGLQIDPSSVKVKVGEGDQAQDLKASEGDVKTYTVSAGTGENGAYVDGQAMSIEFAKDWILANPGAKVTVTYDAALTANAKVKQGETAIDYTNNSATVTYTPDTNHEQTVTTDVKKVDVHTYGIWFTKTDKDNNALQGAEFTIYDAQGKSVITTAVTNGENGVATSDASGYVWFDGLSAGTYTLKETKVPAGKQAVKNFTVTVGDDATLGDNPATGTTENPVVEANFVPYDGDADKDGIQGVVDPDRGILPTTGEAGTFAVTAAGVVLVVGGITLVMGARKRVQE